MSEEKVAKGELLKSVIAEVAKVVTLPSAITLNADEASQITMRSGLLQRKQQEKQQLELELQVLNNEMRLFVISTWKSHGFPELEGEFEFSAPGTLKFIPAAKPAGTNGQAEGEKASK